MPESRPAARWLVPAPDPDHLDALARRLKISHVLAQVLVNRGIDDPADARRFLNPSLNDLHDPGLLADVDTAAERIQRAVVERERIVIYGDYDVDGITAAALLRQLLKMTDADVSIYVPHRVEEGYGLNARAIEQFAAEGVRLIVTVDSGVTAVDEVTLANARGIDCIVTDHHEPDAALPPALAVVNQKRSDCTYPFPSLSGVGVAFKLAWAVAQRFSPGKRVSPEMRAFLLDALGLVALGTVADVVPLVDENRVLTRFGLQALAATRLPGLRALLEQSGVDPGRLSSHHVAFQLAPRINAAGRIGHADLAVELLTTSSPDRAAEIAAELDGLNRERQRAEHAILQQAQEAIAAIPDFDARRAIVLSDGRWHAGIIGIVASRLAGDWCRPVFLIAENDAADDDALAQGSGRSIPALDLFDALQHCSDRLVSYGGHAQAAGLRLKREDIPWFAERFEAHCRDTLADDDMRPQIHVDAEVGFDALTADLLNELDRLGPFGQGNRRPILATTGVRVCGRPRRVGRDGAHLVLVLRHGAVSHRAIGFGMGDRLDEVTRAGACDVAYRLRPDRYRGGDQVELHVTDLRLPAAGQGGP